MLDIAVIFDLDGTLVDSAPDLHAALNHALQRGGRETVSLEAVRHMVGRGARVLLERGLVATGGMPEPEKFEELVEYFFTYYGAHVSDESRVFDGVREALDALRHEGAVMGVCTNKPLQFAIPLLEDLNLASYLDAIIGADSFPFRKPDPRHLTGTLEAMGVASRRAFMVGDSISDIDAAKGAEMPVIAVSFGYTETPVQQLGPDHIIDHFNELLPLIRQLTVSPA
ncbi:MAG: phosphoglycolate phosphatase [Sneathiella sp.]|jgi:phosphoglycolate phosphatase|uniref:phosphoglycolate phosphatase n=1 Tax=Sneathiella sp. TaxID=1964365 RepID=UPI000C44D4EC|nr:phosphoglycolate phosphatase [Sneathiella sp.]MAL79549.1 phosphoglycolate phosphatase [Sneathiella sp.]